MDHQDTTTNTMKMLKKSLKISYIYIIDYSWRVSKSSNRQQYQEKFQVLILLLFRSSNLMRLT